MDPEILMRSKQSLKVLIAISAAAFVFCAGVIVYMVFGENVFAQSAALDMLFWPVILMLASVMVHILLVIRSKSEIFISRSRITGKAGVEGHPIFLRPFDIEFKDIDSLSVDYRHILIESGGVRYRVLCASPKEAEELHLAIYQFTENANYSF